MSAAEPLSVEPRHRRLFAVPEAVEDRNRTLTLRELVRVSYDKSGKERSPDEQHRDHVRGIEYHPRLRLSDLPIYRGIGSASKFRRSKKARKEFADLMADIESGAFGADGLLMWTNSRTSRDAGEWRDLLELCERERKVIVICGADLDFKVYDPRKSEDWKVLMLEAIAAEMYSRQVSEQVKRATKYDAEQGKWHGGRKAYGHDRDPDTGVITLNKTEATLIREAVTRVLGKDSPRSIAVNWNDRRIPTVGGAPAWTPVVLTQILRQPRLAGLRKHGKNADGSPRIVAYGKQPDGKPWPKIISEDEHRAVVHALDARKVTSRGRRSVRSWLLSGLLVCGHCGAGLIGQQDSGVNGRPRTRRYICRKAPGYKGCGSLGIKAEPVEDLLRQAVLLRLDAGQLADGDADNRDDEAAGLRAEYESLEAELDNLAAEVNLPPEERTPRKLANKRAAEVEARQERIEKQLATVTHKVGPRELIAAVGAEGKPWGELTEDQKRGVFDAYLVHVKVMPAIKRGSKAFEPERLKPKWRRLS